MSDLQKIVLCGGMGVFAIYMFPVVRDIYNKHVYPIMNNILTADEEQINTVDRNQIKLINKFRSLSEQDMLKLNKLLRSRSLKLLKMASFLKDPYPSFEEVRHFDYKVFTAILNAHPPVLERDVKSEELLKKMSGLIKKLQ